uniref:hypothetical protein n=1 Tax=Altererythrobacter segetis TaxID=1104773 RepID=UPI00140D0198|nr:hypothetical protein [Altererythrobacter segetis]
MRSFVLVTAALAAIASAPASADDIACPPKVSPELMTALGEPVAWLGAGQTVHTPADLTMVGQPVSYVLAFRASGAADAPVSELDYRLKGQTRPYGTRYAVDLRKAFDKGFNGSDCASGNNSCVVDYKASAAGDFSGAELSEGNIAIPKDAHGDGLGAVKADYNLDSADPVFLVCHYKGP